MGSIEIWIASFWSSLLNSADLPMQFRWSSGRLNDLNLHVLAAAPLIANHRLLGTTHIQVKARPATQRLRSNNYLCLQYVT